ncbi:MAG: hypothetical protein F6K41_05145 [Symploca sp. SIO3E6]|nr:hypothetical protein [Caldora sp. SIO3E6]
MKASEVLRRYRNGERDFSRVSLRGESFKSENLAGADFSEADIRGANFTNACLRGAKFCGTKAGLQRRWTTVLVIVWCLLSGVSGIFSAVAGYLVSFILNDLRYEILAGWIAVIVVVAFIVTTIYQGSRKAVETVAVIVSGNVIVSGIFALTEGVAGRLGGGAFATPTTGIIAGVGAIIGYVIGVVSGVTSGYLIGGVGGLAETFIAALVVVLFTASIAVVNIAKATPGAGAVTVSISVIIIFLHTWISWRTLSGDERDTWICAVAIAFATMGGTTFRGADLTDADFTGARLKSTDFRKANLTRTRWYNANRLDRARPGTSYLSSTRIRELVKTLQGQDQKFDAFSLRGVNLQGANLTDSSFIGADLNKANLQDADLSRAKLVQTQLDEADLTGATLTGATIEDWGITSHTPLQGVRCQYVFMRLPTKDDPNPRRKPDNWEEEFKDGDFADFIKPIVDTLDLYHNQGVDPRAIAISFKQLAENNPDAELEIVAMEKLGKDKFLLRAATAPEADHSQLNAEYFITYNEIKALAAVEVQALLAEKDSRISSLENMVETALKRPGFYAQNYNHQGDTMPDKTSKISISGVTGSKISGVAGGESTAVGGENLTGVAGGNISGTVTNTINQLTKSESPEAPTLADLLKQLQTAIASQDSGLSEKDKQKALKHLDTIGKLGVDRNNSNLQEMAENALDALPTILKRGAGLMEFIKTHFDIELDEMLENIQSILNFT